MTRKGRPRALARRAALVGAVTLLASFALAPAAVAAPNPAPAPPVEGGKNELLDAAIERTSRAFVEAKNAVADSRKKQTALNKEITKLDVRRAALEPQAAEIARHSYINGRIGPALMLLNSDGRDTFLARAETLDMLSAYDNERLAELAANQKQAQAAKSQLDLEVKRETAQLGVMSKQKTEVESAFKLAGGKTVDGNVYVNQPVARQSPRAADGSFPAQSCSVDDPTTNGCITPRMLFALKETQRVGYKRFVSCHRDGGPFEHPKGRACDFSVFKTNDFGSGDAQGDARFYGNNLASFLVKNADKLGILYVIWYRQVWLPTTGNWKSYSGAHGDPSSDHTNHVHLSIL
jgi:peptidoglycan DL-endopeptidase CwlO